MHNFRANTLNELDQAGLNPPIWAYINQMVELELMVIDDFGFMELDLDKCRDLFEVIGSQDARKSTMFVSQLQVKAWYELFADSTYADASLDRMIHKAYRNSEKNMRNPA